MVDRVYVEFTGPWKGIEKCLTGKVWEKNFKRECRVATRINALIMQRLIRTAIFNARKYGRKVSGLTFALKGSTAPLIEHGDLLSSVSHEIKSPYEAHIGILRTAGEEMENIARIVHNGAEIKVSNKMREMFARLHAVSLGVASEASLRSPRAIQLWKSFSSVSEGEVWPTLDGVSKIVVPPRPFTRWALRAKEVKTKIFTNYLIAAMRAFAHPGVWSTMPKYVQ